MSDSKRDCAQAGPDAGRLGGSWLRAIRSRMALRWDHLVMWNGSCSRRHVETWLAEGHEQRWWLWAVAISSSSAFACLDNGQLVDNAVITVLTQ